MNNLYPSLNFSEYKNIGLMILFICFLAIIYPLCLSFLPHLFGIIGLFIVQRERKISLGHSKNILIVLGLICVLTCLSTIWSVTPDITFRRSLKISVGIILFFPLLILIENLKGKSANFIRRFLHIPIILSAIYLLIELLFDLPIMKFFRENDDLIFAWQYNKHVVALVLLSPFAIYFLHQDKKKIFASIVLILCITVAMITDSQAAQLAVFAMLLVALGYKIIPKIMLPLCFGSVVIIFMMMPWISQFSYNSFTSLASPDNILGQASANQRLEIWDFISAKIIDNPLIGYGVDSTRSIDFDARMVYYHNSFILHPHNIALQIWIEFGVIGIFLSGLILLSLYIHLRKLPFHQQSLPLIVFSGLIAVMLVSWSIWSGWLIGLILLLICLYKVDFIFFKNQ